MNSGKPLVFITGASSGIGQALAQRFHAEGWRLALVARRGQEMLDWVKAQGWDGSRVSVHSADVREIASITAAGHDCIARQGLPEVVIANAGISIGVDTADINDLDIMRATLETNILGMAATFQPFVTPMRERRGGTFVGMTSMAGIRGIPGHGAYSSSKAAAISYCESLRGECRPFGVRVVTLVPGYIDTPLTRRNPYSMPFLMTPEAFAECAYRTISRQESYRVIPWQMAIAATILRVLPNAMFDRLFANRPKKPRRKEGA
ncbi:MAG TPA: SDR family oxidoreductase [Burkholderiaceae bacterium]|nr:SDR family oxidoreductase [Burkholderiaceae bacterium]